MQTTQMLEKACSPCCKTQPFLPLRLHGRRHRLRTEDHHTPVLAVAALSFPTSLGWSPWWPPGGTTHTPYCVATYLLVRHHRLWFYFALDPSYVSPCSVVVAGIVIAPIEQYGDQIGHHIVPAIGYTGEIIEAWLGAVVIYEYHWYASEEASLWVAKLGEAGKEGIVVVEIVPRPHPVFALVHCHAMTNGGVTTDATHEWAGHP
jgi:hypothetical protein